MNINETAWVVDNTPLTELTLTETITLCERMGIDAVQHSELIEEMYWDGHTATEIREMIEVEQDRAHYAYIPSL
jgi:hypothetical protein